MIQIAAYRGKSLVSRLIRWQTDSVYSHIAIRFPEGINLSKGTKLLPGDVIEAWQFGGVRLSKSLSTLHKDSTAVDLFQLKWSLAAEKEQKLADFLVAQLGKGYAYRSIFRFLTREPKNLDRKKWFCSELCFAAFEHVGIKLLDRTCDWRVPPDWIPRSPLLEFVATNWTHK